MTKLTILTRWAVLAALLCGAGCYGDVDIVGAAVGGSTASTAEPPPAVIQPLEPRCEVGDVRCGPGADLERCVAVGPSQGWLALQHCASVALCNSDSATCSEPACPFGDQRCNGAVPERCNADQTAREPLGSCLGAAFCSPDAAKCEAENKQAPCCLETPCQVGELRCNGGQIERCRDDQLGLDPVLTCASQKLCERSLGACQASPASCACEPPKCAAGASRCTGALLERCNPDQTDWEPVDTCSTAELCQAGLAQPVAACAPAKCELGAHRCSGALLEVCNTGQTDFEPVRTCAGPAFCNSGAGLCSEAPCRVGEMSCNRGQIERCRADRMGFDPVDTDPCETPALCVVEGGQASCLPPECGVNEFRCAGAQPIRCNAGRTAFVNAGEACLREELCDTSSRRCDSCVPSRRECTPDLRSSRTCSPDGTSFGPLTFCPLGCVASSGACQTCTIGEFRCQGGLLSRCSDGVSFSPLNVGAQCAGSSQLSCNGNQLQTRPCGGLGCNAQRAACNDCSGQQTICADTANFRSCQPDGSFGPATPCGSGLLCAGAGQCSCARGQPSCQGNALRVCNPAGNGLVAGARCSGTNANVLRTCAAGELTTNTCASAALCSSAVGAACAACVEGEASCVLGQPRVCVHGERVAVAACAAGFTCEGAGLCRCAAGDVRCNAGNLVQCSADRQSLEPAPPCAGPSLRSCLGNTLAEQQCATSELCLAARAGVCAQCRDSDAPSCLDQVTELRCVGGQAQTASCDGINLCLDGVGCLL